MSDESHLLACLPRLRRYARALVGDRAGADDLVQDTMERAWQKLASWRRGSDMRPWLFSIMHNLHVDQRRKPVIPTVALDDEDALATPAYAPDRLVGYDLESALRLLAAEQREILLLVVLEEMTYEEVAATLGIPLGTVMSRLSRARERLRTLVEGRPQHSTLKVVK
ncbi:RNA polymerase subunit sigma-24 [Herbaspirillum hiltneri N3]|jgi:RNA polymerase sigma-70 factor (ECF subfamily)|uniref:RNA polymerase subunit sigma-24 n=1 Tax=Herbaspirillum hiltneri N3 TaxID=1262470 RepID=A0ABM5V3A1_9BURK|nr:RNA polymerase sigma factor [Herbaspirillum hiltneri]AKZ63939.1 RNA polymerase subunit sigma-24 [Herbaspirillum hiltneri N3]